MLADPSLVFRDAASCAEALARGEHLARESGQVRIATWNVRWFPDGGPGKQPKAGQGTDIAWLACAIAWLDPAVLVLEEVKRTPHAVAAANDLLARLHAHTGTTWELVVDDCGDPLKQHIAIVYRTDAVRSSGVVTRGELDPTIAPHGTASCPGRLRPGLSAYFVSKKGGVDFHVVGVHLDSGKAKRDYDDRVAAVQRMGPLKEALRATAPDEDIIVLGDFNIMGASEAHVTAAAERGQLGASASRLGYRLASADLPCSEYYRDRATALDHVLVSTTMREARASVARASGACAALACKKLDALWVTALADLSDHCPVYIDIEDADLD